jgi:TonB family protein
MNRLQKKCFVAATGCHLLLLVVLFVGPAFMSSRDKPEDFQVLEVVPDITTDAKVSGGGNPNVIPPPAPPVTQPRATPPPTQLQPVEKVEPPKPRELEPEPDAVEPKADKKPRKPQVNTKLVPNPNTKKTTGSKAKQTESPAREDSQQREAFNNALRSLRNGLSPTTSVETSPGPGGGGPSYANYKQVVGSVYFQAWEVPDDVNTDAATAVASVTIRRDGAVDSARLIRSSGNAIVDRSVQATLDRVRDVGVSFPEGAKEQYRTFTINFNLKAKQQLG